MPSVISGDANVSATEFGYLDGVTSALQTQMDAKAPLASPTFTGTVALPSGTTLDGSTLTSGKILQVVQGVKTDTFSTTSTSFTAATGLSASITPTSATSKVLITVTLGHLDSSSASAVNLRLMRGATPIGVGDAAGSRKQSSFMATPNATRGHSAGITYLDSPSTTSATTYSVEIATETGTAYINRRSSEPDTAAYGRAISTVTLWEIAA